MKSFITILVFLGMMNATFAQQTINGSIMHDGIQRDYILFIPSSYDVDKPAPILFSLHGYGSSAVLNRFYTKFDQIATREGFITIYPQGKLFNGSTHWNVGGFTLGSKIDDVGFIETLLDSISNAYNIDPTRVYSTGMSNGGFMSFVLACQLSDKFAAIASVTGSMTPQTLVNCNPQHPIPILQIHGDADTTVPYNGNIFSIPISKALKYWVDFNNCNEIPTSEVIPDINVNDGSTVEHFMYSDGDNDVNTEHFKVYGGGHTWPGAWGNLDINASREIWKFLSRYDINGLINTTKVDNIDSDEIHFHIYPNPANDRIVVQGDFSKARNFEIISLQGNIFLSGVLKADKQSIDIADLIPGLYILQIDNQSFKLLKDE